MKNKALVAAAFGLIVLQTAASAEMIQGSVQRVDLAGNTLFIHRLASDKNTNLPQELELQVSRDAKLKNIASLQDLKKDSQVNVDVKQNKDLGIWEARSVELNNEIGVR